MNIFSIIIWLLTAVFAYLSMQALLLPETSSAEESPSTFIGYFMISAMIGSLFIGITIILYIIQLFLLK